jgi:hypothetical protein
MIRLLRGDDDAAHELVSRAADVRALERVSAGLRREGDAHGASSALGHVDIDVCPDDVEAVERILTAQPQFQAPTCLRTDLSAEISTTCAPSAGWS